MTFRMSTVISESPGNKGYNLRNLKKRTIVTTRTYELKNNGAVRYTEYLRILTDLPVVLTEDVPKYWEVQDSD